MDFIGHERESTPLHPDELRGHLSHRGKSSYECFLRSAAAREWHQSFTDLVFPVLRRPGWASSCHGFVSQEMNSFTYCLIGLLCKKPIALQENAPLFSPLPPVSFVTYITRINHGEYKLFASK